MNKGGCLEGRKGQGQKGGCKVGRKKATRTVKKGGAGGLTVSVKNDMMKPKAKPKAVKSRTVKKGGAGGLTVNVKNDLVGKKVAKPKAVKKMPKELIARFRAQEKKGREVKKGGAGGLTVKIGGLGKPKAKAVKKAPSSGGKGGCLTGAKGRKPNGGCLVGRKKAGSSVAKSMPKAMPKKRVFKNVAEAKSMAEKAAQQFRSKNAVMPPAGAEALSGNRLAGMIRNAESRGPAPMPPKKKRVVKTFKVGNSKLGQFATVKAGKGAKASVERQRRAKVAEMRRGY